MRIMKHVLISFVVCFFAFCFFLTGCKKEQGLKGLYPVKGKITFKGDPVEGASITLSPVASGGEARAAGASSDAKGEFKIRTLMPDDGAFPGEYKISVQKRVVDTIYTEEEYLAAEAKGISLSSNSKNLLPEKYANGATSGLKFTVVSGNNEDLIIELD